MSPSPFDVVKPLAGKTLEAALNRALSLDPDTRDALRGLGGRRIALALDAPALALEIRVDAEGALRVGPATPLADLPEPDLSIRGTLGGLLGQLPFLRRDDATQVGRVRVSGDADLARRLQQLANRFDPDWERPFVAILGTVLGVQVAQATRNALRQARDASSSFAHQAAEYVTEESRDVVGRAELNAHFDDVDGTRDDIERIAARIARLAAGRNAGSVR